MSQQVPLVRRFRLAILASLTLCLAGCKTVVLHPSGDVAAQQRDLLVESTILMLLIIVPVMALTVFFAWRYRQGNKKAQYEPDWDHSTQLELVIWGAPLLIIICLGALTWLGTHLLDPYRPIDRVASAEPSPDSEPLEVDAVALDWKWLFIYPQYGVATVSEMAAPVGRPISFRITASSVMNAFYIPALAGQIYAMPGMETELHAVIDKAGSYTGLSTNYSGAGFSGMHFAFLGLDPVAFDAWLDAIRRKGGTLDRARYLALEKPSMNEPVRTFQQVDAGLFEAIVNMCVQPGKMCLSQMSAIDAKGGLGLADINAVLPLDYDKSARRGTVFGDEPIDIASLCALPPPAAKAGSAKTGSAMTPASSALPAHVGEAAAATNATPPARVLGFGLPRPPSLPIRLHWSVPTAGGHSSNS